MKTQRRFLFFLFALCSLPGVVRAQNDDSSLIERLKAYRFGGDTTVLDTTARQVAESRANPQRRRRIAGELAEVLRSDAPFDAKQFACRQLVFIAGEEQIPALTGLLQDDSLAHYALLALTRIPGKAVNDALRRDLSRSHVQTQLEIMDILADRGDVGAVPALLDQMRSADLAVASAATSALAKLADPRAVAALRQSYARLSGELRTALGHVLLVCAARLQHRGDLATASALYTLLDTRVASPVQRAAALRGLVQARAETALPRLFKALQEDGTPRQNMAARLTREIAGTQATTRLSAFLPNLTARGQLLLLTALGDRGDPVAAPAVTALCWARDIGVRTAALQALGSLGSATSVPLLLSSAATGSPQEREAARDSLTRLRGASVDASLLRALDMAPPNLRVEAIQSLGQRRASGVVPRLLRAAYSAQPAVRTAALRVLKELGRSADLPALVNLLLVTAPDAREPVIDTVTEIAQRGADEGQRSDVLRARLTAATKPADRAALLTVLARVGGPRALDALHAALTDQAADVRMTALSLLAEWPTDEPMSDLLQIIRTVQDERQRTIALRGTLRMIGANEQRAPNETLALFREVAPLATRPEDRRLMLSGLATIMTPEALEFASGFLTDNDVRAEAEFAVVAIGRGTIGAWPDKTRAALEPIARAGANEEARKRAGETLALLDKAGDFIVAWEVSPAYQQADADYSRLFDIPFPPEEKGRDKEVPWRLMPVVTNPDQPWLLDLLALWGGEQKAAYLRTDVRADSARDMVLEMGSDDGLKVWWNGGVVLARNVARAVAPAQEKVTVHARSGWNSLLLKVTQNIMGWGACARITNPDGSAATGLHFAVPSGVDATTAKP